MLNTMCAVALTATMGQGFYGGGGGLSDQMLPYDTQDPQHHGYYQRMPSYGGFNSFRPYNYKHALSQAQAAGGWGLPPVMPYSQQFWNRYQFRASGVQPNLPNMSHPNFQNFGPNQSGNQGYNTGYQTGPPPVPPQYPGNPYTNYPGNPQGLYSAQPPPVNPYQLQQNQAIPAGGSYYPPVAPTIDPAAYQLLQRLEEQKYQLQQQIESLRQMQQQRSQPQPYPYPTGRPYPTPSRGLYGP